MTLVEAFLDDRAQVWRAVEQQTLIFVAEILLLYLFLTVQIPGPQFPVFELFDFDYPVASLYSVVLFMVPDSAQHLKLRN